MASPNSTVEPAATSLTVVSAVASWSVSIAPVVSARSEKAWTTSYGAWVRDSGIVAFSFMSPSPAGVSAR